MAAGGEEPGMAIGMMGLADTRSVSMMQAMSYQTGQARGGSSGKQADGAAVSPAYSLELTAKSNKSGPELQRLKRTGQIECQACKERKYQDGSNDPGVSFKAPGHISPESSAAVVMSHEQEHVGNEQAKANQEDREVISQSVRLFTAVCPECGKAYVSGGETRTTTASKPQKTESNSPQGNQVDFSV
jgi:hypothetical protein